VASWDNLTNKGLMKIVPDLTLVWNQDQKREAVELHGVPAERVAITGAQLFDDWFEMTPSVSRAAFCEPLGLDPAQPYFLYTASSIFINRNEVDFVARWIEALRGCGDPRLAKAGVLIRPHPKSGKIAKQWDDPRVNGQPNLAVFPRGGRMPIAAADKQDYFHSLTFCAGVVGINTSAMLEAGIVGKRCFAIRLPELEQSQDGQVHFAHLVNHGFIRTSDGFAEHVEQLARELDRDGDSNGAPDIEAFLRPHGLEQPAVPLAQAAIIEASKRAALPHQTPFIAPLLRPLIALGAAALPRILDHLAGDAATGRGAKRSSAPAKAPAIRAKKRRSYS